MKSTTQYDVLGRKQTETLGVDQGTATTAGFVPLTRTYFYDAADRLTWVRTDNLWVVDALGTAGTPSTQTTFGSVWTGLEYDPLDRQTRQIDGAKTTGERHTITAFDAADNAVSVTTGYSPTAKITTVDGKTATYSRPVTTGYTYDPLCRVRRVLVGSDLSDAVVANELKFTRPDTRFDYDASGHVTVVTTNSSTGELNGPRSFLRIDDCSASARSRASFSREFSGFNCLLLVNSRRFSERT